VIQILALYVITHGHYSPGGGFQGGVLLAVGLVLVRLSYGTDFGQRQLTTAQATVQSAVGTLLYLGLGLLIVALGGLLFDYAALPAGDLSAPETRFFAILYIEAAVGLAVAAALVSMYDHLLDGDANG
jgi:multicomponent Na+:H+ antiporter subunit B